MGEDEAKEQEQNEGAPPAPKWEGITADDVAATEVDGPIRGLNSPDCSDFREPFYKAAQAELDNGNAAASRVYSLLADITGFHFRPENDESPFGPLFVMGDRRSAIPDDFKGDPVEAIVKIAEASTTLALQARSADLAWLLEKRRVGVGRNAVGAYLETIKAIVEGGLKSQIDLRNEATGVYVYELLQRALRLSSFKSLFGNSEDREPVLAAAKSIVDLALAGSDPYAVLRFKRLLLNFRVEEGAVIALGIEDWLKANAETDEHGRLDLLRLAAEGYRRGQKNDDANRLKLAAVDQLAAMAETALAERGSASIASSWLSDAISYLHGLPNARERRKQLMHRLVDVQADIQDEMASFPFEMDLQEIAERRLASLQGMSLRDILFIVASMEQSPHPDDLRKAELQNIADHPLSALFGGTHHDRDGKVVYKSEAVNLSGDPTDESLRPGIARAESIRRSVIAMGELRASLHYLNENFYISDTTLATLLRHSIFVPPHLLLTYSVGFARFLQSDFVAATYILTPLLEASIKQLLVRSGHQVTKFDAATGTQEDLTISGLFEQMRPEISKVLGEAITTDIENVFLRKPGPTIRHDVAHGLMSDGDPYGSDAMYACWLLFRLCLIPLGRHREKFPADLN